MKRLALIAGAIALSVALAACTPATNSNSNTAVIDLVNDVANTAPVVTQDANGNTNAATNSSTPAAANVNTSTATAITITSSGFSPSAVTVKAGTVVTWTNSSGADVRVASDPHPTHTDLPELDSSTLANGDSYSFTFTKVGTWGYHDHFEPTLKGSVTVQ